MLDAANGEQDHNENISKFGYGLHLKLIGEGWELEEDAQYNPQFRNGRYFSK